MYYEEDDKTQERITVTVALKKTIYLSYEETPIHTREESIRESMEEQNLLPKVEGWQFDEMWID